MCSTRMKLDKLEDESEVEILISVNGPKSVTSSITEPFNFSCTSYTELAKYS